MENQNETDLISGYHRYVLGENPHLCAVGANLCAMLLCSASDLLGEEDRYLSFVHPADRPAYLRFLAKFSQFEKTDSLSYRLVRRDGVVFDVRDTLSSRRGADGVFFGVSTLCDITELKNENQNLRYLNENLPCGFLTYSCEKIPQVTYANERMLEILRFPETNGEGEDLKLYCGNIYLIIPVEERRRFSLFLKKVYLKNTPVAGEITVTRYDGTRAVLFGLVTKAVNARGQEEFQSVCIDITEGRRDRDTDEVERYVKALSDVYDKILAYHFHDRVVRYLHGTPSGPFGDMHNIPMEMEEATRRWIRGTVVEEDRERVERFFDEMISGNRGDAEGKPPRIRYRALSSSGTVKTYLGVLLKITDDIGFYCCKKISDEENDQLRHENLSLRSRNESMQELVMHFTEGMMAFEISADSQTVRRLYASENLRRFFGYSKEEWEPMIGVEQKIADFIAGSRVDGAMVKNLLENGEAEFPYIDTATGTPRRVKAICSQKKADGVSARYVMLYHIGSGETGANEPQVRIRTFGYFEVFITDRPIPFRNKKPKELLALLVDRRGGYITSEEAISFLWEDEPADAVTLARYRKVALRLKNILEEYGIADIVETVDGKRRLVPEKVRCDLYDYLTGRPEYAALFKGSYLSNYSWGETTLGELTGGLHDM